MEILYLGHFLASCFLTEGVVILIIKLDSLFNFTSNLDSILVLDIVPLSLGRKYLEHPNELLGIIDDMPCPLPLGHVEGIIISCIVGTGDLVILFDDLHMPQCLFSSVL